MGPSCLPGHQPMLWEQRPGTFNLYSAILGIATELNITKPGVAHPGTWEAETKGLRMPWATWWVQGWPELWKNTHLKPKQTKEDIQLHSQFLIVQHLLEIATATTFKELTGCPAPCRGTFSFSRQAVICAQGTNSHGYMSALSSESCHSLEWWGGSVQMNSSIRTQRIKCSTHGET